MDCLRKWRVTVQTGGRRQLICVIVAILSLGVWPRIVSAEQGLLSVPGITESIYDVTLGAPVAGTVATIFFKEGARVKKGAIILEFDKRLEELEVERRKVIWQSKAEVNSARARVVTLKSQLKATKELFKSTGSISREDLEKQELEYALAMAEQLRLEVAEERERIEYEMALEQLRKRSLRAPFTGVITELFLDEGENYEPDEPLVHIVDASQCLFVCNIEEALGRTLQTDQAVELRIRAGEDAITKKGRIIFVSPVVDPASGLIKVKAVFENQDSRIYPGVAGGMLLGGSVTAAAD